MEATRSAFNVRFCKLEDVRRYRMNQAEVGSGLERVLC